ncbi:ABC-three component system protein [Photobacterium angustum]|uniref:ABC-three component system protein n=1 Tax=Photobacterium angustum TaxID=661 RepID=UPI000B2E5DA4|nr:ABC-three component system protein [Photobacterium angustum]
MDFFFKGEKSNYLLSSKHSLCLNFNTCKNRVCDFCLAPVDNHSVSSDCIEFKTIDIYQSKSEDIALAKILTEDNSKHVVVKEYSTYDEEFQAWKGGTVDRLILKTPKRDKTKVQLDISSNINAHGDDKNDEVEGFSGSPVFINNHGDELLVGVLTDSCGINDISCVLLTNDIINELESYYEENIFKFQEKEDIIDRSMKINNFDNLSSSTLENNALTRLIESSKSLAIEDQSYRDMLDELQDFLTARPGRQIIGLDAKLIEGDRLDLLEDATYLENKFARRVSRNQLSDKEQIVYFHCLSKINSYFKSYIQPLIKQGDDISVIDCAIQEKIITPLYEEILTVQPMTMEMVMGMLYFLTGKCHLRWK